MSKNAQVFLKEAISLEKKFKIINSLVHGQSVVTLSLPLYHFKTFGKNRIPLNPMLKVLYFWVVKLGHK